jgi:hypothetical protein
MKTIYLTIASLIPAAFPTTTLCADMAPQPQVIFTKGLENTFAADWQGVEGRIYFMQWSLDMQTWFYAPFMDFGGGMHSRGMAGSSDKAFYRLHYGDYPGINSLADAMNADFDSDGLANIFEVTFGYDPYNPNSTLDGADNSLDPEEDGMTNDTENTRKLDPMLKDNPALLLQVTVE